MKIVVAGGTGFVGRHISRALLDAGHEVGVLGRDPGKVQQIEMLAGASGIRGDVTDPASLQGTLEGAQAVVGVVQFPNYPVQIARKGLTFDRYDRRGTEHLLTEAKRAGVSQYVYLSGAGADLSSDRSWFRAKGLAEKAVADSGLDFCVLRPSWAYGPEDKALNRFAAISRFSPVVPRIGHRPQEVQPVHVDDIAGAVGRVFERATAWGQVIEIGGPEVLTMDAVIRTMLKVLGRRRLIVPIPAPVAMLGTAPLVLLPKPLMSPGGIAFAVGDAVVDNSKLTDILDLHPVRLEEGLRRYLTG